MSDGEARKFADLIVLDHALLTGMAHDILNNKVVLTVLAGKIGYEQRASVD